MSWGYQWRPYVPVARRKANGKAFALKLAKKEKRELKRSIELVGPCHDRLVLGKGLVRKPGML